MEEKEITTAEMNDMFNSALRGMMRDFDLDEDFYETFCDNFYEDEDGEIYERL